MTLAASEPRTVEVIEAGALSTVQDLPGRIGYWHVGVPPSGPMDDLSHRLVNRIVGNPDDAATVELTGRGPTLRFGHDSVVAVGGAHMPLRVGDQSIAPWTPVNVPEGTTISIGAVDGAGLRAYLAVRGGIDTPSYLGSRATFTLGGFGGHCGRALRAGDCLRLGDDEGLHDSPAHPAPGIAPTISHHWEIGVTVGPHGVPDFLTEAGLLELFRATWEVHFNSARTGVRLIGPRPLWARQDGGEAGLHPSNIHDTGYAVGAVDFTGDMPVILGPDGPSLGGFVCPAVVVSTERWKLGQLAPGDRVRLVPWSSEAAARAGQERQQWLSHVTSPIEPLARPTWNAPMRATGQASDAVLGRVSTGDGTEVTYRQAGDRFLLVEYGPMALDLEIRGRVHSLDRWVTQHLVDGVVDATPGVRSLLIQVDGNRLDIPRVLDAVMQAEAELDDVSETPFESRVVHLPLSWDDPSTRLAIERYMNGVRSDAPWCPWNIEFIRRINGLASVAEVRDIVFDASYLVMGLGDVYLGAPVATPLDPRHRLVTTKYNPARTWTPENAVGIGGAYLCIYGMEGPGGYQFVGRTVQVWNRHRRGPHFTQPWLLRPFDQLRFYPVSAEELLEMREAQAAGELPLRIEESQFNLADYRRFLGVHEQEIDLFQSRQRSAFADERDAWDSAGEFG